MPRAERVAHPNHGTSALDRQCPLEHRADPDHPGDHAAAEALERLLHAGMRRGERGHRRHERVGRRRAGGRPSPSGPRLLSALLSALLQARATGRGRDVGTCLFDVALHQLGYTALRSLNAGHVPARQRRSAHFSVAPVQTAPTADGWRFIMSLTPEFRDAMLGILGREDLNADPIRING